MFIETGSGRNHVSLSTRFKNQARCIVLAIAICFAVPTLINAQGAQVPAQPQGIAPATGATNSAAPAALEAQQVRLKQWPT